MPDGGYYYGTGAFETMALENGEIEFLDRHLRRLGHALDFFHIDHSEEEIREQLATYIGAHRSQLTGHDVIKLAVSEREQHISIRQNTYLPETRIQGFRAEISPIRRNETSPLTYHKTLCYAENLLEKQRIVSRGKQEVIFLNGRGEVTEGSTANIFFISEGKLYTPEVSCGLLPGIFREVICERYEVMECRIGLQELQDFEAAFFTNSLMGIMPVRSIGRISYDAEMVLQVMTAE